MSAVKAKKQKGRNIYLTAILAWLVPGAGHWYVGSRGRGWVIFVGICGTFGLGVFLGGVEMIDPQNAKAWFCAHIFSGLPGLIGMLAQNPQVPITAIYGRGVDIGQVYAGVAGLLNLLCILDALSRVGEASALQKG